jgi:hypothetical protein
MEKLEDMACKIHELLSCREGSITMARLVVYIIEEFLPSSLRTIAADVKRNVGSRTWKTKKDRSQKRHAAVNDSSGVSPEEMPICRFLDAA